MADTNGPWSEIHARCNHDQQGEYLRRIEQVVGGDDGRSKAPCKPAGHPDRHHDGEIQRDERPYAPERPSRNATWWPIGAPPAPRAHRAYAGSEREFVDDEVVVDVRRRREHHTGEHRVA